MRVTRSLLLLMAIGLVAAGCASQSAVDGPSAQNAPSSIDQATYGTTGTVAAGATSAPGSQHDGRGYSEASSPPPSERGLFTTPPPVPSASAAPAYAASAPPAVPPSAQVTAPSTVATPTYVPGATYAYVSSAAPRWAYTLDSGDRLRIVVFGQDGLTNSYAIDASGHIAMPLIGSVMARGATTDELANRVAEKLRNGYVRDPHVAVEIEAYRPFFILGEVTQPGQYPYVVNMTAETAVAIAGGFGPRAYRDSVILNRTSNGQITRMTVPLSYPLRPGDTINVQERWF